MTRPFDLMSTLARRWLPYAALLASLLVIPTVFGDDSFQLQKYNFFLILILLTISFNVVTGYAGQLALSSGAVFLIAGYTVGILMDRHPEAIGLWISCLVATVVGGALGFVFALPALRIGGFYLAMITMFIALVVPVTASALDITGGLSGLSLYANPLFTQEYEGHTLYVIIVVILVAVVLLSGALLNSRLGRRFVVLKTSPELARSIGIAGHWTKITAFAIGSAIAGLAGALYVYSQQLITPSSATANTAFYLVAAGIIGGLGRVWGPVVGGALVFGTDIFFTGLEHYQGLLFGVALLLFVLLAPNGITGLAADAVRDRRRRRVSLRTQNDLPTLEVYGGAGKRPGRRMVDPEPPGGAGNNLELRHVSRSFGGVRALQDVNLTVRSGHVHGLVGSNGSGKTTALNLICGYVRAEAGQILLDDEQIEHWPAHRIANHGVARTFQKPKLIADATVLQNVLPAAESARRGSNLGSVLRLPRARRAEAEATEAALEILGRLDILAWKDAMAESLPHGTRRLVEVARALALRPKFLLLDEPAAGLSSAELATLGDAITAAAETGIGVLLIEHNVPFVINVADELTVLHRGEVLATGAPSILQDTSISSVFLGSDADVVVQEVTR